MPIKGYFEEVRRLLASSLFVTSHTITEEHRPPSAGLIRGLLTFTDGSQLQFKEFVVYKDSIQIKKYSYHFTIRGPANWFFGMTIPLTRQRDTYLHIPITNISPTILFLLTRPAYPRS